MIGPEAVLLLRANLLFIAANRAPSSEWLIPVGYYSGQLVNRRAEVTRQLAASPQMQPQQVPPEQPPAGAVWIISDIEFAAVSTHSRRAGQGEGGLGCSKGRRPRSGQSADAAALRRLRKDRPDIHARVLAGELSPHAGMIEAGFRKRSARNEGEGERV